MCLTLVPLYLDKALKVCYNSDNSIELKGHAVVTGQDRKIILIFHGSTHVRVSGNL